MTTLVSWLQFDTASTPVDVTVSWLSFDTASNYQEQPTQAAQVYGHGYPSREDVEKHWELIALRDQEESRIAASKAATEEQSTSSSVPLPKISYSSKASIALSNPDTLQASISNQVDHYLEAQQKIDVIARRKRQNEEAIILILMQM